MDRGDAQLHLVPAGEPFGEALDLVPGNLRLNQAGRAIIRRAKSDSGVRNPFIPRWVSDRLAEWLAGRNLAPSDPLFTVPRRRIQEHHVDVCQRLGITGQLRAPADEPGEAEANANYTINDHRHTAAVALAREGLPLHMLKEQLGHSTIDMTMRYASFHPAYRDVAQYFDRVGEAWLGDGGSDPFSGGSVTS